MELTYAETSRVYRHLYEVKESLGTTLSRRDRAVVLIGVCIVRGFDTRHLIIKGLRVTGLSPEHVVGLLDQQTGPVVGVHHWTCDSDGRYRLLDT